MDEAAFEKLYAGLKQGNRLNKKAGEGMPTKG